MRWTQLVVCLLTLGMAVGLVLYLSPYIVPLIAHHQTAGILTTLENELLTLHSKQSFIQHYFPYGLFGAGVVMYLVIGYDLKTRVRTTHGSAMPATRGEARQYHAPRSTLNRYTVSAPARALQVILGRQPAETRLRLGKYHGLEISLSQEQQVRNVLLTAPIGAGKTVRVMIPNVLQERGQRSLFIPDVKGEMLRETAGTLQDFYEIKVFAPLRPQESDGYNPLAHIHSVEDAQTLAACWVANTGSSGHDTFWVRGAEKLMTAAMLHLKQTEPHAGFGRVADILCKLSYDEMKDTLIRSPSRHARETSFRFFEDLEKTERTAGALGVEIGTRFSLLLSDQIRACTLTNDIDFRAMGERPIALYLSIPPRATERLHPLMACFLLQMFSAWEERAEQERNRQLPQPVFCYMDEFANLGFVPNFSGILTTLRHAGVGMLLVLQSFNQLDERYGLHTRKNILTNTTTHLLLPGSGLEECEFYSKRIGDTTVLTNSRSSQGGSGGFFSSSVDTWTESEARRPLYTPDELRRMGPDEMLVLEASSAPMIVETKPYFLIKKLARLAGVPFTTVHVRPERVPPTPAPKSPRGLPPGASPAPGATGGTGSSPVPPIIVDAGQDGDEDDIFFQK